MFPIRDIAKDNTDHATLEATSALRGSTAGLDRRNIFS
jgi:hypothetical protein